MRILPAICCSTALALTLGFAAATTSTAAVKSSSLVAKGKMLISADRCNGCHGADLAGKRGRTPTLHASGPMRHYTAKTFARFMSTGVMDDGKAVGMPMSMVCKLSPADGVALYAYLRTVK